MLPPNGEPGLNATARSHAPRYDVVVLGGGVAGLYAALGAARQGARILVLAKGGPRSTASHRAQGGIAAALGSDDSPSLHAADTERAGRGLCRPSAVDVLVEEAPERIADLVDLGVRFDDVLGLEGGHSRRRVLSVDGAGTGAKVAAALGAQVLAHAGIDVSRDERALDLWCAEGRCVGVVTDRRSVSTPATLLATGGAAALWERTTNPPGATGDGIAMAYRAGAAVADLELVQFHPTALAGTDLLLSEALRGDGALLVDGEGRRFTDELAPRDEVARAIGARGTALLDLRPVDRSRFPGLMATIEGAGYDPGADPVPVAPAAHYTMGGVVTDLHARTEVAGLYAMGEVACTGVHGANRLASNSLLECLVFAERGARAALAETGPSGALPPAPDILRSSPEAERITPGVRRAVWREAGLVRQASGLEALRRSPVPLVRLIAEAALARTESRGAHFRADFPTEDPALAGHFVLRAGQAPVLEHWD
ncbi:MAG: FAD-dependent oxidoreductase [Actinobacteria bacterium]|nr:FAD-dependent oxidoreductase [Actinomycetota bacterium]